MSRKESANAVPCSRVVVNPVFVVILVVCDAVLLKIFFIIIIIQIRVNLLTSRSILNFFACLSL